MSYQINHLYDGIMIPYHILSNEQINELIARINYTPKYEREENKYLLNTFSKFYEYIKSSDLTLLTNLLDKVFLSIDNTGYTIEKSNKLKINHNINDNFNIKKWDDEDTNRLENSIKLYNIDYDLYQLFIQQMGYNYEGNKNLNKKGLIIYNNHDIFQVFFFSSEQTRNTFFDSFNELITSLSPPSPSPSSSSSPLPAMSKHDAQRFPLGSRILQQTKIGGKKIFNKKRSKRKRSKRKRSKNKNTLKKKRSKKKRH